MSPDYAPGYVYPMLDAQFLLAKSLGTKAPTKGDKSGLEWFILDCAPRAQSLSQEVIELRCQLRELRERPFGVCVG